MSTSVFIGRACYRLFELTNHSLFMPSLTHLNTENQIIPRELARKHGGPFWLDRNFDM